MERSPLVTAILGRRQALTASWSFLPDRAVLQFRLLNKSLLLVFLLAQHGMDFTSYPLLREEFIGNNVDFVQNNHSDVNPSSLISDFINWVYKEKTNHLGYKKLLVYLSLTMNQHNYDEIKFLLNISEIEFLEVALIWNLDHYNLKEAHNIAMNLPTIPMSTQVIRSFLNDLNVFNEIQFRLNCNYIPTENHEVNTLYLNSYRQKENQQTLSRSDIRRMIDLKGDFIGDINADRAKHFNNLDLCDILELVKTLPCEDAIACIRKLEMQSKSCNKLLFYYYCRYLIFNFGNIPDVKNELIRRKYTKLNQLSTQELGMILLISLESNNIQSINFPIYFFIDKEDYDSAAQYIQCLEEFNDDLSTEKTGSITDRYELKNQLFDILGQERWSQNATHNSDLPNIIRQCKNLTERFMDRRIESTLIRNNDEFFLRNVIPDWLDNYYKEIIDSKRSMDVVYSDEKDEVVEPEMVEEDKAVEPEMVEEDKTVEPEMVGEDKVIEPENVDAVNNQDIYNENNASVLEESKIVYFENPIFIQPQQVAEGVIQEMPHDIPNCGIVEERVHNIEELEKLSSIELNSAIPDLSVKVVYAESENEVPEHADTDKRKKPESGEELVDIIPEGLIKPSVEADENANDLAKDDSMLNPSQLLFIDDHPESKISLSIQDNYEQNVVLEVQPISSHIDETNTCVTGQEISVQENCINSADKTFEMEKSLISLDLMTKETSDMESCIQDTDSVYTDNNTTSIPMENLDVNVNLSCNMSGSKLEDISLIKDDLNKEDVSTHSEIVSSINEEGKTDEICDMIIESKSIYIESTEVLNESTIFKSIVNQGSEFESAIADETFNNTNSKLSNSILMDASLIHDTEMISLSPINNMANKYIIDNSIKLSTPVKNGSLGLIEASFYSPRSDGLSFDASIEVYKDPSIEKIIESDFESDTKNNNNDQEKENLDDKKEQTNITLFKSMDINEKSIHSDADLSLRSGILPNDSNNNLFISFNESMANKSLITTPQLKLVENDEFVIRETELRDSIEYTSFREVEVHEMSITESKYNSSGLLKAAASPCSTVSNKVFSTPQSDKSISKSILSSIKTNGTPSRILSSSKIIDDDMDIEMKVSPSLSVKSKTSPIVKDKSISNGLSKWKNLWSPRGGNIENDSKPVSLIRKILSFNKSQIPVKDTKESNSSLRNDINSNFISKEFSKASNLTDCDNLCTALTISQEDSIDIISIKDDKQDNFEYTSEINYEELNSSNESSSEHKISKRKSRRNKKSNNAATMQKDLSNNVFLSEDKTNVPLLKDTYSEPKIKFAASLAQIARKNKRKLAKAKAVHDRLAETKRKEIELLIQKAKEEAYQESRKNDEIEKDEDSDKSNLIVSEDFTSDANIEAELLTTSISPLKENSAIMQKDSSNNVFLFEDKTNVPLLKDTYSEPKIKFAASLAQIARKNKRKLAKAKAVHDRLAETKRKEIELLIQKAKEEAYQESRKNDEIEKDEDSDKSNLIVSEDFTSNANIEAELLTTSISPLTKKAKMDNINQPILPILDIENISASSSKLNQIDPEKENSIDILSISENCTPVNSAPSTIKKKQLQSGTPRRSVRLASKVNHEQGEYARNHYDEMMMDEIAVTPHNLKTPSKSNYNKKNTSLEKKVKEEVENTDISIDVTKLDDTIDIENISSSTILKNINLTPKNEKAENDTSILLNKSANDIISYNTTMEIIIDGDSELHLKDFTTNEISNEKKNFNGEENNDNTLTINKNNSKVTERKNRSRRKALKYKN